MAMTTGLKPGHTLPNQANTNQSALWRSRAESNVREGETLPPTKTPGAKFTLVDPTTNKSGR